MIINELIIDQYGNEQEIYREMTEQEIASLPKNNVIPTSQYELQCMIEEAYVESVYAATLAEIMMG